MQTQKRMKGSRRESSWNILELLKWTSTFFSSHDVEDPRASAEILLAHALHLERIDLYIRYDQPLSRDELARFKTFVKRRLNREPVAYITGGKEFWSMMLDVTPAVLIPRPETECLVETALSLLPEQPFAGECPSPPRVLELGTGSGAVVLAVASRRPLFCYFATDLSESAVRTAKRNAVHHRLDRKVRFITGDWFAPISRTRGCFDMILSNPPYVPTPDIPGLQPEIARHEPIQALDGGQDGLRCLNRIIETAHRHLKPGGRLILEIGDQQRDDVDRIIATCDKYRDVHFLRDYSGRWRVVHMEPRK